MTYKPQLVTIVIPCFNDAQFIEQAVLSAISQNYEPKEIIVVDDGSNLETKKILKNLSPKINKLITQENKGQSAARNAGIREANGEFILNLDSDDYFEPTFCEKAMSAIKANPDTKIVTCHTKRIFENGNSDIFKPKGGTILDFLIRSCAMGSALFQKSEWERVGGYDENMTMGWEDWEFYIRVLKNGGKAVVLKEVLFNYRARKDSTTAIANKNRSELYKYIYYKHIELYTENFKQTITFLLNLADHHSKNEMKRINSIDYKLGNFILRPFRFLKRLFS